MKEGNGVIAGKKNGIKDSFLLVVFYIGRINSMYMLMRMIQQGGRNWGKLAGLQEQPHRHY